MGSDWCVCIWGLMKVLRWLAGEGWGQLGTRSAGHAWHVCSHAKGGPLTTLCLGHVQCVTVGQVARARGRGVEVGKKVE
jgi:hypothetical protein